jgi:RNA polymerase sigma factor (sigma-70 family)
VKKTEDEILMMDIRNGKLEEMAVLYERYHVRLYNFFLKMGLKKDISQDLTQNLFYRMIKYRSSYKEGNSVKSWMYQIARNLHSDYCKQEKKSGELFITTYEYPSVGNNEDDKYSEEDYERLDNALLLLSDEHRELIVLSRFQGLKYEEISSITSLSVPAIKVAVYRAIRKLRCIYFQKA